MNESPSLHLPLLSVSLSAGEPGRTDGKSSVSPLVQVQGNVQVGWARHLDEVRQAQRLRFDVFAAEMGARLSTTLPGHDIDLFDDYCEHLLVRDVTSQQVIGTYRVLTPAQAKRVGAPTATMSLT